MTHVDSEPRKQPAKPYKYWRPCDGIGVNGHEWKPDYISHISNHYYCIRCGIVVRALEGTQ